MLILDILEVEVDANPHCRLFRRHLAPLWAENLFGSHVAGRDHHHHGFHVQIPSN
jgi:hypothetical protein